MSVSRRALVAAIPSGLLAGLLGRAGAASAAEPASVTADTLTTHSVGRPDAGLVVQEWFSLTCTHCAHFNQVVFPEIRAKLIDTGRIRYVFNDFPLDQVALAASMVADALPDGRYLPFVDALFASQDRWAFARDADPVEELRKRALLAGLSDARFRSVMADQALQKAIIDKQDQGRRQYRIDGTPTFVFGTTVQPIVADYAAFAGYIQAAGG